MVLKVNGKEEIINKDPLSVTALLEIDKVEMPDMVSVQLNGEFVKRPDFGKVFLKEGDEVDFLYFMGGGNG